MEDSLRLYLAYALTKDNVGSRAVEELYNLQKKCAQVEVAEADERALVQFTKDLERAGIGTVSRWDSDYPGKLEVMSNPPSIIFYKGNYDLLKSKKIIAVVGTRNLSDYGRRAMRTLFEKKVDEANGAIVYLSGLAYGADSEIHKIALKIGVPTIAVVAGGLTDGYPVGNQALYEEIADRGLVIAEFPPGRKAIKGMYPIRNRIVAGLADSVVVVESKLRGGSLITADFAFKMNKRVFAVPGSIFEERSAGCNYLLRCGAAVLCSNTDVSREFEISFVDDVAGRISDLSVSSVLKNFLVFANGNNLEVFTVNDIDNYMRSRQNSKNPDSMCAMKILSELTKLELEGILIRESCNYRIVL